MTMIVERMRPVGWGTMSDLRPTGEVRFVAVPPPVGKATYTRLVNGGVRVVLPDQMHGEIWEIVEWERLDEVLANLRARPFGGGCPEESTACS